MSYFSCLRNRTSTWSLRGRAKRRPAAPGFRPQLEVLEDRCVPSTLEVTNTADSGKGSLRYEIAHANSNGKDTIVFAPNLDHQTITLTSGQLNITSGVNIQGPGAGLLTLTTDFQPDDPPYGFYGFRLFDVSANRPVTISGLTITNGTGNANGSTTQPDDGEGGAILNFGTLTVSGCTISGNSADLYGGAIYNAGTMSVSGCTISQDRAGLSPSPSGGGIYNAGTMTVSGSALSFDYSAYTADAIDNNGGALTVSTSTFVWDNIEGSYTDGGGNTFITGRPQIGSFTASPASVSAGDSVTLTVTGITDPNPDSAITEIYFYVNGYGGIPFGYGTQTSPGVWTFTFSTTGWTPGTYTFNATAVDNYGTTSDVVYTTLQVS